MRKYDYLPFFVDAPYFDKGIKCKMPRITIYNWEHEKARPRKAQLADLVAVRGIGKREALKKLAELEQQTAKKGTGKKR